MTVTLDMLKAHPKESDVTNSQLAACVDACLECVTVCGQCADACLSEEMVAELRICIVTNLNCVDICTATASILGRQSSPVLFEAELLRLCRSACGQCADECERHASMHEHCRLCADACRRCERACDQLLQKT